MHSFGHDPGLTVFPCTDVWNQTAAGSIWRFQRRWSSAVLGPRRTLCSSARASAGRP